MDVLLKGVNVPRMIGPQPVRITSLGAAQQESLLHDHFGRIWQQRIWSLGYADAYVEVLALYWHFVELVWIFLLPLLYMAGHHSAANLGF